jgi:hypothetical protein
MRNLIDLIEGHKPVYILDLPDPSKSLAAFQALADGQRNGDPERLGGATLENPGIHVGGQYASLTEHVGDITNRMAKNFDYYKGSYDNVRDKVAMGLRRVQGGDIRAQVIRNYDYRTHPDRDVEHQKHGSPKRFTGTLDDWLAYWKNAGSLYAAAHAKLPVWNEAQWHAREAAVASGRLLFTAVQRHLTALERHLGSSAEWTLYAGQVTIDETGTPLPFHSAP